MIETWMEGQGFFAILCPSISLNIHLVQICTKQYSSHNAYRHELFFIVFIGGGGVILWCCQYLKYVVSNDKLIKELERIWKELVMT
jgi:hypothetical protein